MNIFRLILCGLTSILMAACSSDSPDEPTPAPTPAVEEEFVTMTLGYEMNVTEEKVTKGSQTRSDNNSRDLFGVSILHLSKNNMGGLTPHQYAYGVFDDVEPMVFKFKKGQQYQILFTYYPNAKDIVWKNSDGTYGVPFNDPYLPSPAYKINEPQYYSGNYPGFQYFSIMKNIYQNSEDDYDIKCVRGTTPLYMGATNVIINEPGAINIQLESCLMGIKLNCSNFESGILTLEYEQVGEHRVVDFKPGDVLEDKIQIVLPHVNYSVNSGTAGILPQYDYIKLYYKTADEQRFLLATKELEWKTNTNYIFTFNLDNREDGSIGIIMPSDKSMIDQNVEFD